MLKKKIGVKSHSEGFELFNLKEDPQQTTNLVKEHPKKVEELKKLLEKYVNEGRILLR